MRRILGVALLTFALLQLGYRGMQRVRFELPLWDFISVYAAAGTWVNGGNPYDLPSVLTTWRTAGVLSERDTSYFATVYPPTSLAMVMPLWFLPATAALIAWLLVMLSLLALQFAALADLAQLKWRDPRTLILIGAALASAPLQFGILAGQLSLPAISLCILAFWCVSRSRDGLAGVLLGLAAAIKFQLAAPFVVYYLIVRRPKVAMTAMLLASAILGLSIAGLKLAHIDWMRDWPRAVAATGETGGVNDYGWTGEYRDEIVDLKMLLVTPVQDLLLSRLVVVCLVAGLLAWYVRSARLLKPGPRSELLTLAGLSAISLLPTYHRVYDVTLLTTALAWALAELDGPRRRYALPLLAAMTIFLIPFDVVGTIGNRVPDFRAISKSNWWQTLIAPHYAWGMLALTLTLLWTMTRLAVKRPVTERLPEGAVLADEDEDVIVAH